MKRIVTGLIYSILVFIVYTICFFIGTLKVGDSVNFFSWVGVGVSLIVFSLLVFFIGLGGIAVMMVVIELRPLTARINQLSEIIISHFKEKGISDVKK